MWHSDMTVQEMHLAYIEKTRGDLRHAKMMRDQWQKSVEQLEARLATLGKISANK